VTVGSGSLKSVSVSVGVATGLYGISFGALGATAGLDIYQTVALSIFMFSGGSQFAFIGVLASGGIGSLPAAVTSSWLLGVRNGFYALSLAPILKLSGFRRVLGAQLTIDESAAVSTSRESHSEQVKGFWFTGISVFVFWNIATGLGFLLGNSIGDPKQFGLDAAAAAALFALVWPRLLNLLGGFVGLVALVSAVILVPLLPPGMPVLAAAVLAVGFGTLISRWIK